jgi:hypothetical protein
MYVKAYHKSVNIRPAKQVLTEDEFYNLVWNYAIKNTPGAGEDDHTYQEAQELVDRIYSEATEDRFNCGDYSLFIRHDSWDLGSIERPDK